jgi:hypothetical protein
MEAGIEIPFLQNHGWMVSDVFTKNDLRDVLDSITLIYQCLQKRGRSPTGHEWKSFVTRCLKEENVGYQLDAECGVHYFVDEEFERNRFSTLTALNEPELQGVKAAYEDAYCLYSKKDHDVRSVIRNLAC